MGADLTKQISTLKHDIQHALATLQKGLSRSQTQTSKRHSQTDARTNPSDDSRQVRKRLAATLAECTSVASDMVIALTLLDSLPFEQMGFRHSKIQPAHSGTLEWVFSTQWKSWIESADPIFWISGKPGSGKSTLMKYLVHNSKSHLSSSHNLVLVDYFFWVGGTDIQRSQEGLLRSLLYDILRQNTQLIKLVLPDAWQDVRSRLASGIVPLHLAWRRQAWTRGELLEAFHQLSTFEEWTTKLLIFIDGLDEYDGDHGDLIGMIDNLTRLGVRLCVASRPWNIFEDAFGSNLKRKLYLQDLNKGDMQHYVDDNLRDQLNFQRLEPFQADEIVREIVEKSQGVFLWVYLVVRSLLEGLRNRDSISLLRKRLREFPSDLDQFFRYMFLSLEGVYKTHLSHMFQIALTANQPLSPIAYWHLDEIEENPEVVLEMPSYVGRALDVFDMIDDMTVRINGRCKGLLEVTTAQNAHWKPNIEAYTHYFQGVEADHADTIYSRVDFLHRTVRDFFTTTNMRHTLSEWQNPGFNADLAICKIMLAELKQVALMPWTLGEPHILQPVIEEFLESALRLEKRSQTLPLVYLDDFERTFVRHNEMCGNASTLDPWMFLGCSTFFEVAVMYDLRVFVTERMAKKPLSMEEKAQCVQATLRNQNLWKPDNGRSLGSEGLPEITVVLLSQGPALEFEGGLQDAVLERLSKLDSQTLVSVLRGLHKHSLVDSTAIGNPDGQLHQLILRTLTWTEYLDLCKFFRGERRRQPLSPIMGLADPPLSPTTIAVPPVATSDSTSKLKRNSVRVVVKRLAQKFR